MTKVLISLSDDMLFNPKTHTTRYSLKRCLQAALSRRMPGLEAQVGRILGDDGYNTMADFSASGMIDCAGTQVAVQVDCTCNRHDVLIKSVSMTADDMEKPVTVQPAEIYRKPEEAFAFIKQLAANCCG